MFVWTLADCEWRAAAPGLKPLRLPRAPMHAHNGLSDPRSLVQARLTARTGALVRTALDHFVSRVWARDGVWRRRGGMVLVCHLAGNILLAGHKALAAP